MLKEYKLKSLKDKHEALVVTEVKKEEKPKAEVKKKK